MYDVTGEKRPILVESDALLHNLGDPSIRRQGPREGFHGKRDTLERDIIIGGFLSFSPIVGSAKLVKNRPILMRPVAFSPASSYIKIHLKDLLMYGLA
jgi:hypothetical protein